MASNRLEGIILNIGKNSEFSFGLYLFLSFLMIRSQIFMHSDLFSIESKKQGSFADIRAMVAWKKKFLIPGKD